MSYKQDWLLRKIENITQFIERLMFNKDYIKYEIRYIINLSEADFLYKDILTLLEQNKICEAEDLLFKSFKVENLDYLKLAIDFYRKINELTDDQLENYNFSRGEIVEGLKEVLKIYGVQDLGLL